MTCFRPPDPTIHHVIRVSKLILTVFSVIMAIISAVIIKQTASISKDYARLLYMIIFSAAIFDVYSQLIFDPQYIMPYLCVYRDAPIFNLPLTPAWGFVIWVTLMALNIPIYAACFIHRHQIIVPPRSIFKLRTYSHSLLLAVILGPSLSYGFTYYVSY
ncbi:hypothetical protein PMAYCL1PPCAC_19542, partial [Pristionchus mayeri]